MSHERVHTEETRSDDADTSGLGSRRIGRDHVLSTVHPMVTQVTLTGYSWTLETPTIDGTVVKVRREVRTP